VFLYSRRAKAVSVLSLGLLLILLVSCGKVTNGNGKVTNGNPTVSSSSVRLASPPLRLASPSLGGISVNLPTQHLRIFSPFGFQCQTHGALPMESDSPYIPHSNLVLNQAHFTYTPSELQQMQNYVSVYFQDSNLYYPYTRKPESLLPPLPQTLRWVSGRDLSNDYPFNRCFGILEITNTGNSTIQVQDINMLSLQASQRNTYHYLGVDLCSLLLPPAACGCWCAGEEVATYDYSLHAAQAGTIFSPEARNFNGSPPGKGFSPTILPSQQTTNVNFDFISASGGNLSYLLRPQIVISTEGETQTFGLSQLDSTISFANKNQFSCYTLRGRTFLPFDKAPPLPDPNQAPEGGCI
jgi:hypothetical protein